jgi:hypothetical protein
MLYAGQRELDGATRAFVPFVPASPLAVRSSAQRRKLSNFSNKINLL